MLLLRAYRGIADATVEARLTCFDEQLQQQVQQYTVYADIAYQCAVLVVACSTHVVEYGEALDLVEANSWVGEGNFGAPPDGRSVQERDARRKKAYYLDPERLSMWQRQRYWIERRDYLLALKLRAEAGMRGLELEQR